jgi:hypothetical protein
MTSDPADYRALTPAHFLIGSPFQSVPEEDVTTVPTNRLDRWKRTQRMYQEICQRFHAEYLKTLQARVKWTSGQPNIPLGTLVLVKESDASFSNHKWNLARVTNLFPGKDGRVRVVEIRTPSGALFRRPIVKIAPIPLDA